MTSQYPQYKKEHGDFALYMKEGESPLFMSPDIAVAYTQDSNMTTMHKHGPPDQVRAWVADQRAKGAESIFGPIDIIESAAWDLEELNKVLQISGYLGSVLQRSEEKKPAPGRICFTGGAEGADYVWGRFAQQYGWEARVLSFHGHNMYPNTVGDVLRLPPPYLVMADAYLEKANRNLKRRFPSTSENVNKLLRRNYWQVCESHQVVAVGVLDKNMKVVDGGTGWAVQMGLDMHLPSYVFDQNKGQWFSWNNWLGIFDECQVPALEDRFTGIGTRKINKDGIAAIKEVFTVTMDQQT